MIRTGFKLEYKAFRVDNLDEVDFVEAAMRVNSVPTRMPAVHGSASCLGDFTPAGLVERQFPNVWYFALRAHEHCGMGNGGHVYRSLHILVGRRGGEERSVRVGDDSLKRTQMPYVELMGLEDHK